MEVQNKGEKKSNRVYIVIILLQLVAIITLVYLLMEEKQNVKKEIVEKTVIIEKSNSLQNDLAELKKSYQDLKTDDENVKAQLYLKIAQIDQMQKEAEKHKNDPYIIAKLKKETETLRKIMKGFVVTIDSLNTLNQQLIAEKAQITSDLSTEKKKTQQLNKDKDDLKGVIELAAVLKASAFKASGVRYKSGGKKEIETPKAKKTEKIRVNFTIGENKVAKSGDRNLYLRIISPEGKEISESTDEANMFKFGDSRGYFASKQTISYSNQEYMVTMYATNSTGFVSGQYIIEVYCDGLIIGQSNYTLE